MAAQPSCLIKDKRLSIYDYITFDINFHTREKESDIEEEIGSGTLIIWNWDLSLVDKEDEL